MHRINYNSDFDFRLGLGYRTADGKPAVGIPPFDFVLRFTTPSSSKVYIVSQKDGVLKNAFADGDMLHVVMDSHGLLPGVLICSQAGYVPNKIYPDGTQKLVIPRTLGIELVTDAGDEEIDDITLELMAPYIKGEPFRWEDLTPEQIAELQRPATEAAEKVGRAESRRVEMETARQRAEETRVQNEKSRMKAENERKAQETERQKAETRRDNTISNIEKSESLREAAEEAREEAEKKRVEEFAGMTGEIAGKQNKLSVSDDFMLSAKSELALSESYKQSSKLAYFIDRYNTLFGSHGKYDPVNAPDDKHPFYGNTLWMTYEEALRVVEAGAPKIGTQFCPKVRTNIPFTTAPYGVFNGFFGFGHSNHITEVINVSNTVASGDIARLAQGSNFFLWDNRVLREVIGVISVAEITKFSTFTFGSCPLLEEIKITGLKCSVKFFVSSPLLSLESLQYMVANAANTSAITITVHADVYAKLTDESNAEWYAVLTSAADRNISFATV